MKRAIVDYKKLTPELMGLLASKYPYGYDDDAIIYFQNAKNETIEAIEVKTNECIYLVKVSTKLASKMKNFDFEEINDNDTPILDT